ncbi:MAG: hypothetical protein WD231_03185 [Candidatus Woykebacteria bacterium]
MKETSQHTKEQSGQILIVFLLVLVVGLAIVLSVASRSITDIRTTTTSDESNRAYFAAEAGVEEALKKLEGDSSFSGTLPELDFSTLNQTKAKISVKDISAGSNAFSFPSEVSKDEVVQISLLVDFNNLGSGSPVPAAGNPANIDIFWGHEGIGRGANAPAMEVTVVYLEGGAFKLRKFAFDPNNGRIGGGAGNNFCLNSTDAPDDVSTPPGTDTNVGKIDFEFVQTFDIRSGISDCNSALLDLEGIGNASVPVLARIRFLYNLVAHPIAVKGNGWDLPIQGSEIESTGTTNSGVTRKLKVVRQFPALPAIFDYVLFSGTNLTK